MSQRARSKAEVANTGVSKNNSKRTASPHAPTLSQGKGGPPASPERARGFPRGTGLRGEGRFSMLRAFLYSVVPPLVQPSGFLRHPDMLVHGQGTSEEGSLCGRRQSCVWSGR